MKDVLRGEMQAALTWQVRGQIDVCGYDPSLFMLFAMNLRGTQTTREL